MEIPDNNRKGSILMAFNDFNASSDNINTFRQKMQILQPTNKYKIILSSPTFDTYTTYPDAITIPDRNIQTMEYTVGGFTREVPMYGFTGKLLISFIMLTDMKFLNFIEKWLALVVGNTSIQSPHNDFYSQSTTSYNAAIGQLDIMMYHGYATGQTTKIYHVDEAYPISIQPIELGAALSGYLSCNVLFYVRSLLNNSTDVSSTAVIVATQTNITSN